MFGFDAEIGISSRVREGRISGGQRAVVWVQSQILVRVARDPEAVHGGVEVVSV